MQKIHAEKLLAEDKKITDKDLVRIVDQIEQGDEERAKKAQLIDQALDYQEIERNEKKLKEIKDAVQITNQIDEEIIVKMKEKVRIIDKEDEEESALKKEIKEIEDSDATSTTVLKKTKRESEVASKKNVTILHCYIYILCIVLHFPHLSVIHK